MIAPRVGRGSRLGALVVVVASRSCSGRAATSRRRERARIDSRPSSSARSARACRSPTARRADVEAIRADIKRRIAAGQSDAEIRQAYVDRYGESILLTPQGSGIGLSCGCCPWSCSCSAPPASVFALRRNRREPQLHATDADERARRRGERGR